jgi:hypothetical protein
MVHERGIGTFGLDGNNTYVHSPATRGKHMRSDVHPRMVREEKTVEAMIRLYCQDRHAGHDGLCAECSTLADYARERLAGCPYQERKTTCAKCPVHCYRPAMREQIRAVMRYAGPRMLLRHPWLAVMHLLDRLKSEPR